MISKKLFYNCFFTKKFANLHYRFLKDTGFTILSGFVMLSETILLYVAISGFWKLSRSTSVILNAFNPKDLSLRTLATFYKTRTIWNCFHSRAKKQLNYFRANKAKLKFKNQKKHHTKSRFKKLFREKYNVSWVCPFFIKISGWSEFSDSRWSS